MEKYVRVEKIGEGTYGVVFRGRHVTSGEAVAIKKIKVDSDSDGVPATALREISLLKELIHPNVVTLKEVLFEENKLYLIFEFMGMDLKKYLDSLKHSKGLEPEQVKSYMYQIFQAILFCHSRRILHRDLKPQNLLIDGRGIIKIADFGLGRSIGIPVRVYTHEVVTLWYRAPEVLLGSPRYSFPVDIWSLGCIFAEMATLKPLFQGDSEIDQLFRIFRVLTTPTEVSWPGVSKLTDYKLTFPKWTRNCLTSHLSGMESQAIDLVKRMLTYNPSERITAKEALHCDYFNNFNLNTIPINYQSCY